MERFNNRYKRDMKQTAVEQLANKLPFELKFLLMTEIEQAKAMEKEQIIDAWFGGYLNGESKTELKSEQYYNETYKSE